MELLEVRWWNRSFLPLPCHCSLLCSQKCCSGGNRDPHANLLTSGWLVAPVVKTFLKKQHSQTTGYRFFSLLLLYLKGTATHIYKAVYIVLPVSLILIFAFAEAVGSCLGEIGPINFSTTALQHNKSTSYYSAVDLFEDRDLRCTFIMLSLINNALIDHW